MVVLMVVVIVVVVVVVDLEIVVDLLNVVPEVESILLLTGLWVVASTQN